VDTSFGIGGTASAQLASNLAATPDAVAIERDGKILVAGYTSTASGQDQLLAQRCFQIADAMLKAR
jgi:hypothetical protein